MLFDTQSQAARSNSLFYYQINLDSGNAILISKVTNKWINLESAMLHNITKIHISH